MPVTVGVKGLGKAQKMLKTLAKLGNSIKAVELNAKEREGDSDLNNAEVLDYLAEAGRDFVTLSPKEQDKLKEILEEKLGKGIKRVKESDDPNRKAKEVVAKAFIEAGMYWQERITAHIEEQDWIGDGGELNEDYAKKKEKEHGFRKPIGVATGQVKDNVQPGKRNLKLKR